MIRAFLRSPLPMRCSSSWLSWSRSYRFFPPLYRNIGTPASRIPHGCTYFTGFCLVLIEPHDKSVFPSKLQPLQYLLATISLASSVRQGLTSGSSVRRLPTRSSTSISSKHYSAPMAIVDFFSTITLYLEVILNVRFTRRKSFRPVLIFIRLRHRRATSFRSCACCVRFASSSLVASPTRSRYSSVPSHDSREYAIFFILF